MASKENNHARLQRDIKSMRAAIARTADTTRANILRAKVEILEEKQEKEEKHDDWFGKHYF